jgi:hypothetical protein
MRRWNNFGSDRKGRGVVGEGAKREKEGDRWIAGLCFSNVTVVVRKSLHRRGNVKDNYLADDEFILRV